MFVLIAAVVVLAVLGVTFLLSYSKSKNVYDDYLETVDKKEYGFKDFMPIGFYLNEKLNLQKLLPAQLNRHLHKYKSHVRAQIIELHGAKYADYYLMIHNGNKTAISLVVATGAALLSVITGSQGDADAGGVFLAASIAALAGVPFLIDKGLAEKIDKRRLTLQMDFPDFINKLTLLVNAGMTISRAMDKIATDDKKGTPLYTELKYALGEIRSGKSEAVAYEEFGRRCKVKEIVKFVSVIVMNLRKGGAEVVPVLKLQSAECWEMRKNVAKRLGEEAATKILMPLMIMFVGILIIVATPAVMSFSMGM